MKLGKAKPGLCRTLKKEIAERRKQYEIEKAWGLWERNRDTLYRQEYKAKKGGRAK